MSDKHTPAIEQIASTPEILRLLMAQLSDEDARWKPAPDRMSVAEVLEHLSHGEAHCYRVRLDRILAESEPAIEIYDQEPYIAAGQYSGRDPEESFAHFEEQREDNIDLLRSLEPEDFERTAIHAAYGSFTLSDMVNEWALHDLAHVRQISELIRARLFYANSGSLRKSSTVKP